MLKKPVYLLGLTWRQLRDDPGRAPRLTVRLLARVAPGPLGGRLRRSRLAVPRPRGLQRETAELRALLARPARSRPAHPAASTSVPAGAPAGTRVLHLVTNAMPRTNAGYTVRTHRIALAQRELGFDAHVATRLGYPLSQGIGDARPRVEVDGVTYHRLIPWLPPSNPVRAVDKGADLAGRLVKELRPTVLHAVSNHLNAAVALELGRRHDLPVVYEVRGFLEDSWLSRDPSHSENDDFYRLTRELETRRMTEADAVVTLGEAMREEIASRGVPAEKIFTVPNGVDEAFLQPLPDAADLRVELGLPADVPVVGLTSSFYGYEGIDTLIDAAALLRERGTPVTLLLVGDGPERGALERRAAGHGVHAVFTGRVPMGSVRRYHALLDVFAVPRRADRVCQLVTPLKPIEAMAGGIPVIASDVKALREIVEPGVTGTLTLPEEPEAWANSLDELIYAPERRQKIGRAAREWVRAERTWRAVAAGYRAAYAIE
ncbi:glycosyltransferase family 4 protein [Actinomadura roseirufa]|uniref:glycosyltransferase family 4 protein n=1 Tax=Actinomadura roseirufa TaxID=2094049 RepID=UPI001F5E5CF3|nr:glycosyltransferase family 4 protein [Actinomadura roseirufa]